MLFRKGLVQFIQVSNLFFQKEKWATLAKQTINPKNTSKFSVSVASKNQKLSVSFEGIDKIMCE